MQTFHVNRPAELLDFLVQSSANRTQAKKWLRLRRVTVNGKPVERHDHPLTAGDVVEIGPPRRLPASEGVSGIPVLYEDEAILVIDKPAGLLTIATDAERTRTAYHKLNAHLQRQSEDDRVFIVHRLDRETSGLLVFARTEDAKQILQADWDDVEKRYYAVVEGVPAEKTGTIKGYLAENSVFRVYADRRTKHAKHAVTHYAVLASDGERSLLEIRTETGRKHQIRVHLADLGHPIVGDDKYGKGRTRGRLGLHASYLKFQHPVSGETLEFRSELPTALREGFPSFKRPRRGGMPSPKA